LTLERYKSRRLLFANRHERQTPGDVMFVQAQIDTRARRRKCRRGHTIARGVVNRTDRRPVEEQR